MGTHRKSSKSTQLKKTFAVGAIAGAAAGFGALSLAPTAFADIVNEDNEGWWLGSGNLNNNNNVIGNNGNGIVNQNGAANGNIMNNQLNALSPVIGGTAAQVNTPVNLNVPVTANTPIATGNGAGTGTTLGVNPALAAPIGLGAGLGGSPVGLNGGAAIPVTAGAAVPVQIPVQVPILANQNNTNNQTGVGAQNTGATTGAVIDDSGDEGGDGIGNLQVAGADSGDVEGGDNEVETNLNGTATAGSIANHNTPSNSAIAAGNNANNSSNNNTVNNNGNGSSNSVGNDNENEND